MQGRDTFTASEADTIRALLTSLPNIDRTAQKSARARLRRLGFYISDFAAPGEGVTARDFDRLVASRRLHIRGEGRAAAVEPAQRTPVAPARPSSTTQVGVVDVAEGLVAMDPVTAAAARPPADTSGVYAWWTTADVLPGVPLSAHHVHDGLGLAYVGIAYPETLRGRIVGNHLGGSTGSSTLRKSVAALLADTMGWERRWTAGTETTKPRAVLVTASNRELSELLGRRFLVSWVTHSAPRDIESDVIRLLRPPLNTTYNAGHTFLPSLAAARQAFSRRPE